MLPCYALYLVRIKICYCLFITTRLAVFLDSPAAVAASSVSPRTLAKELNIKSPSKLEANIVRELERNGIFDSSDVAESEGAADGRLDRL